MGGKDELSASTVLVDPATDIERWRLLDERGRQTWHYLQSDEQVKQWPQTTADRHHLGLPLVGFDILYWAHVIDILCPGFTQVPKALHTARGC